MFRRLSIAMLFSVAAYAQTAGTATLLGNVTDSTGAAVVGARVAVVNPETSATLATLTTSEGTYQVPYLAPGSYMATVEAPGFKRYVREGLVVRTGEVPRVDVQLEIGGVTESVQVSGAAPLLDTETATARQVLDGDLLVKIPVSQKRAIRNPLLHAGGERDRRIHSPRTTIACDGLYGGPNQWQGAGHRTDQRHRRPDLDHAGRL